MKVRSALLAATLLAAPIAAKAQPVSGLYIAGGLGANWIQDEKLRLGAQPVGLGRPLFSSGNISFNTGFVGLGSVGFGLGNGLRVEVEGDYRDNTVQKIHTGAGPFNLPTHGGGEVRQYGVMGNVFYDFAFVPYVTPYVGVGAGYQWANWNAVRAYDNIGDQLRLNHQQGSFAAQGIVGVGVPIPAVPGLTATLDYRFLALTDSRTYPGTETTFGGTFAGGIPAGQYRTSGRVNDEYNHSVLLGVRYAFNTPVPPPPAPAPAAAPAPAPTRSYLVFFDWDRYNLTERAREIVREAAENSTRVQYTRIQVNGYTDTSGTPRYNQRLSVRRAQSVAAELVKDGVPRSAISIQGFGETHLLVPTGPGVREPQNRRVEIIIQ